MVPKVVNLVGEKINRLKVVKDAGKRHGGQIVWLCECDCGNIVEVRTGNLRSNGTKSCGCYRREATRASRLSKGKHNLSHHPIYRTWSKIKDRCYNKNTHCYADYGGRGIKVCREWLDDVVVFFDWATNNGYGPELEIDRIDNDGDYEPSNCRWTNRVVQSNNRRSNLRVEFNGEIDTLANHCRKLGVNYNIARSRISRFKWDIQKALTKPSQKRAGRGLYVAH